MKILANDGISNSGEKVLKEVGLNLLDNRVSQEHLIPFINENQVEVLSFLYMKSVCVWVT